MKLFSLISPTVLVFCAKLLWKQFLCIHCLFVCRTSSIILVWDHSRQSHCSNYVVKVPSVSFLCFGRWSHSIYMVKEFDFTRSWIFWETLRRKTYLRLSFHDTKDKYFYCNSLLFSFFCLNENADLLNFYFFSGIY